MGKNKSVRKAVEKFADETSTHAIRFIVLEKSKAVRVIWLVLLLVSTGFFIYEMQKLLKAYYKRPTLTSVEKKGTDYLHFPAITICRGSSLSRSGGIQDHPILLRPSLRDFNMMTGDRMGLRAFLANDYTRKLYTLADAKRAAGNPSALFMQGIDSSCVFGLHDYCYYPHNISDIITSSYGGICYQFNKNGKVVQRDAGSYYGLSMIMFVNQSDFVPFSSFDFGSGIIMKIHDAGEYPFPEIDGLLLSPGSLTRISLKKVVYNRLKSPYPSNCTDGTNIDILYPGKYTIKNCKRSCIVRDSLDSCGSSDPLTMMLLNQTGRLKYKPNDITTQNCVLIAASTSTSSERRKCSCPVPCREVEYVPTISQTTWPSQEDLPYYKHIFAKEIGMEVSEVSDQFIYSNFLQINVYFDEMSYQEVREQKEWTLEKLISDIGGQIGVWIGASVLSLCEIGFFIFRLFKILFTRSKKENVNITLK